MGAQETIFGYSFQNDDRTLKHFLKINVEVNMTVKNVSLFLSEKFSLNNKRHNKVNINPGRLLW